jgi:hypothetical protein
VSRCSHTDRIVAEALETDSRSIDHDAHLRSCADCQSAVARVSRFERALGRTAAGLVTQRLETSDLQPVAMRPALQPITTRRPASSVVGLAAAVGAVAAMGLLMLVFFGRPDIGRPASSPDTEGPLPTPIAAHETPALSPSPPTSVSPAPTPSGTADAEPAGGRPVRIEGALLSPDGTSLTLFSMGGGCLPYDYHVSTEVSGDELVVSIRRVVDRTVPTLPPDTACIMIGYMRELTLELAEPYLGSVVRDRNGQTLQLYSDVDLVSVDLPSSWRLESAQLWSGNPIAQRRQVFVDEAGQQLNGAARLELIEGFRWTMDAFRDQRQVDMEVSGDEAALFTDPSDGALTLIWTPRPGVQSYALRASNTGLTARDLVRIAESARPLDVVPNPVTVAVHGPRDSEPPEELILQIGDTGWFGYGGVASVDARGSLPVRLIGRESCTVYASLVALPGSAWIIRFGEDGPVSLEDWTGRGMDSGPALVERPLGCGPTQTAPDG